MKHDMKTRIMKLPDGYTLIQLSEKDYEEFNTFFKSYFKKWNLKTTIKRSWLLIPGCWLGLRKEGLLVGSCAASFGSVKEIEIMWAAVIVNVAVHHNFRGKGFGTFLVNEIVSKLHQKGYKNIYVSVLKKNKSARSVYEKVGFVRI